VKRQGHGLAADWWAVGVLLFELLYSVTPFGGGMEGGVELSELEVYKRIADHRSDAMQFPGLMSETGGITEWSNALSGNGTRPDASQKGLGGAAPSDEANALIETLLSLDEGARLGAASAGRTGVSLLKSHAWFELEKDTGARGPKGAKAKSAAKGSAGLKNQPFDWELLAQGRLKPPVRPAGGAARVTIT
jgi:hypothetical protein